MKIVNMFRSVLVSTAVLCSGNLAAQSENFLEPGALTDSDDEFVIKSEDWYAVQRYVSSSLGLPDNEADLRILLRLKDSDSFEPFVRMASTFATTRSHAKNWDSEIMPQLVQLAVDTYNYADRANVYYGPLEDAIDALIENEDDAKAKKMVTDLLKDLANRAQTYMTRSTEAIAQLENFSGVLKQDASDIGNLYKHYESQYGEESEALSSLQKQINEQVELMKQLNSDYEKYVQAAATTPTYAWVFPFGTIAAGTVAGVYGDKAVRTLAAIQELQSKIDALGKKATLYSRLITTVGLARDSSKSIADDVNAALPAIQKIQGHWASMHGDITEIVNLLNQDVSEAIPLLLNLDVAIAKGKWVVLGKQARGYVRNAYITVLPSPTL
jgi:hypothetical protein